MQQHALAGVSLDEPGQPLERRHQHCLAGDVEHDTAHVALVQQRSPADGFEYERIAEGVGGSSRLVGRRREPPRHERQAVSLEQRGLRAIPIGHGRPHPTGRCRVRLDVLERAADLRPPGRVGDRVHAAHGVGKRGHAAGLELVGHALGHADPRDRERLRLARAQLDERVGQLVGRSPDQVHAQQAGVELRRDEGVFEAVDHEPRPEHDVRRHVDGIAEGGVRRQPGRESRAQRLVGGRDAEPSIVADVGHEHAGAAGVAQERETIAHLAGQRGEELERVDEALDRADADGAVPGHDGAVDFVGAHQGSRMRASRLLADGRAPDLQEHDRLAGRQRPSQRRGQLAAVAHAFDVPGDDSRSRIVDEVVAEIREVEVGLVARADEVADLHAGGAAHGDHGSAEGAALGDEGDRTRLHRLVEGLADRGHGRVPEIHATHRVRPAHPDVPLVSHAAQLGLARGSLGADLGVARGQHERHADLARLALRERAHDALRGHRDDEDIDGSRNRDDRGVARQAVDLGRAGIDREDPARVAVLAKEVERQRADLRTVTGGPEDGDRLRRHQPLDGRASRRR